MPTPAAVRLFYADMNGPDPYVDDIYVDNWLTEHEAAERYSDKLVAQGGSPARVLAIVPPGHPLPKSLSDRGFQVDVATDRLAELEADDVYDAAIVLFQLERASAPLQLLERVHRALKSEGVLEIVTPSLDSVSARLLGPRWTEWRPENLYYFDTRTIQSALLRSSFWNIRVDSDVRRYSLQHLRSRATHMPRTLVTSSVVALTRFLPRTLARSVRIPLPASSMVVTARRATPRANAMLSVIMPVYNERATFAQTLDTLLCKNLPGVSKEVIVVESKSTDGTRDIALTYRDHPQVRLILQDEAHGKGNAVRAGLKVATGDIVLIQDADLEYDVNDYEALLEPLLSFQSAFVLGSRHSKGWKIRIFNDQPFVAAIFNFGHVAFLWLFNLLYRQSLSDPFTMFKVFRTDCLRGLRLECDRFDFDFELVIKLIRKGYWPKEIPVNYRGRSYREGKKVSFWRDPLTWLRALAKYRVVSIWESAEH